MLKEQKGDMLSTHCHSKSLNNLFTFGIACVFFYNVDHNNQVTRLLFLANDGGILGKLSNRNRNFVISLFGKD
jgi:predicted HAD superfamily hydrolase